MSRLLLLAASSADCAHHPSSRAAQRPERTTCDVACARGRAGGRRAHRGGSRERSTTGRVGSARLHGRQLVGDLALHGSRGLSLRCDGLLLLPRSGGCVPRLDCQLRHLLRLRHKGKALHGAGALPTVR